MCGDSRQPNGSVSKKEPELWEKLGLPATLQQNLCDSWMRHYNYWETLMTGTAGLEFWTDTLSSLPNSLEKRFQPGTSPSLLNPQAIHIMQEI